MPSDITRLLHDWQTGKDDAFKALFAVVYEELRNIAASYMRRERSDHTLQTTALVHVAYLRLMGSRQGPPENRLHFFAAAATVMRHILIDHARSRGAERRGGDLARVPIEDATLMALEHGPDLIALDQALTRLASFDERKAHVVELRFFGGMTIEETARYLKVSTNTVVRDWEMARAWLYRAMNGDGH